MLVTGQELVGGSANRLIEIVCEAVSGGVDRVQLREPAMPGDRLVELTARLRKDLPPGVLLVVNSSVEAARRADGLHLPEAAPRINRRELPAGSLLGRSIHSVEAAVEADREVAGVRADYLIAGAIFQSPSHPGVRGQGLLFLGSVCSAVSLPVIAIGGIRPETASGCLASGAAGIAVRSPILQARDPRAAARQYREALDRAGPGA